MKIQQKIKFSVKKEQIVEIMFILVLILSVAVAMVIGAYLYSQIRPAINDPSIATAESISAYNKIDVAYHILDNTMPFIIIGLTLGLIVTSFLIPTHPVFIIVNIVGFMVLVFLGAITSNVYEQITNSSTIMQNVTATYYPTTSWIITQMPWVGAILVLICSIVMYSKGRNSL